MGRRAKRKSIAAIEKKIQQGGYKEEDDALGDLVTAGITAYGAKLLYDGLKDAPVEDIEIPKGTDKPPPSDKEKFEEDPSKHFQQWEDYMGRSDRAKLTKKNIAETSTKAKAGRGKSLEQAMGDADTDRAAEARALKMAKEFEEDPSKHVQQWKETRGTGRGPGRIKEFEAYTKERERTRKSIDETSKRAKAGGEKSLELAMGQNRDYLGKRPEGDKVKVLTDEDEPTFIKEEYGSYAPEDFSDLDREHDVVRARLTKENIAETTKRKQQGAGKSLSLAMDQDAPVREAAQDRDRDARARERQFGRRERDSAGRAQSKRDIAQSNMKRRTDHSRKKRQEFENKYKTSPEGFEYKPRESYKSSYPTARGRAANRDRLAEVQGPQQGLMQRLRGRLGF